MNKLLNIFAYIYIGPKPQWFYIRHDDRVTTVQPYGFSMTLYGGKVDKHQFIYLIATRVYERFIVN